MTVKSNTFVEAALHYEKNVFEKVSPGSKVVNICDAYEFVPLSNPHFRESYPAIP